MNPPGGAAEAQLRQARRLIFLQRRALLLAAILLWGAGCRGEIQPMNPDVNSISDHRVIWLEGSVVPLPDSSVVPLPDSSLRRYDLSVTQGEACTFGQCGEGLICIANVCRTKCNGFCGEKAPECDEGDPCIWASDFTGACFRGSLAPGENCGDGAFCQADTLCVQISGESRCYPLCGPDGSCPAGYRRCSTTQPMQCKICTP